MITEEANRKKTQKPKLAKALTQIQSIKGMITPMINL